MVVADGDGWSDLGWNAWTDLALIRSRLDAGADPHSGTYFNRLPLYEAAEHGSPEVVEELARRVDNVDADHEGRTALWEAVFANRPDNARALVAAGADPWRPMMAGWSPGRLSLASPTPDLFIPPGEAGLSATEAAAVTEAERLIAALGHFYYEGVGLACVAGISATEAAQRLEATPIEDSLPDDLSGDEGLHIIGATDVPGGCVISQSWGYAPSMPGVLKRLSAGTICYGMYANPVSGNQGTVARDGMLEERGRRPGGGIVSADESAEEILAAYLYRHKPVPYCCASAVLRLADARAIDGEPDRWLRLPERDWWH
ncbi:ankyrin repeat domain-containing protein [Nonomuraea sp. NPDC026600]|uniref:ankyrin repeat domain-containing protein n=1 Tax=Nonomuraea sp. NPDC026600 TaxID=3155363 RepID=UPI0033F4A06E